MVYHYLCTYANEKPDLALLCINTLQKDCKDEDPMVRGLALRSLCSLRILNMMEYIMTPVRQGLKDESEYVRRTAVLGIAKLFALDAPTVRDGDMVDLLYSMLRDDKASVIANVIVALNEILRSEGGMAINSKIVFYLLNRIREFNEWGQCTVLDLVSNYTPESQQTMLDVMNLLNDRLKHNNAGVVLASAKLFLNYTKSIPQLHQQVVTRLKTPLLLQMGGGSVELSFGIISHIRQLVLRCPQVFTQDNTFKQFFCRLNDPTCVKILKLDILTDIATESSMSEILNELSEYVGDENSEIGRATVRAIGNISSRLDAAIDESIEHLLSFFDLRLDHITSESCVVIRDILCKFPERYEE